MGRLSSRLVIWASLVFGAGSHVVFFIFLLLGPFYATDLGMSRAGALAVDVSLSLLFFLQHSLLVRKGIKRRITKVMSERYYGAFYSITSGIALISAVGLWQGTTGALISTHGWWYWLVRSLFFIGTAGIIWAISTLGPSVDPYGIQGISGRKGLHTTGQGSLNVRGAYQWVRHPLYLFTMLMIWSCPDLTADRLLFNTLWTVWIVMGTFLEEKDLVENFGEQYREYQSRVPMLLPWKIQGY